MTIEKEIFKPHWPEGLEPFMLQRNSIGRTSLSVQPDGKNGVIHIGLDGDVNKVYTIQTMEFDSEKNPRTYQTLLWLAQAIRLDNEENNI